MRWGLLVVFASALAGCSTPLFLTEQPRPPSDISSYAVTSLYRASTVDVDLTDCPDDPMMTKKGLSGVTRPVSSFPFRKVLAKECDKIVRANFRVRRAGDKPDAELKVSAERVVLRRDGSLTSCDIELVVELRWLTPGRPSLNRHYEARRASLFANDALVPDCIYHALQDISRQFLRDLSLLNADLERRQSESTKW